MVAIISIVPAAVLRAWCGVDHVHCTSRSGVTAIISVVHVAVIRAWCGVDHVHCAGRSGVVAIIIHNIRDNTRNGCACGHHQDLRRSRR